MLSANWFQISSLQIRVLSDGGENKLMDFDGGTTRFLWQASFRQMAANYLSFTEGTSQDRNCNSVFGIRSRLNRKAGKSHYRKTTRHLGGYLIIARLFLNADNKQAFIESDEGIRLYDVERQISASTYHVRGSTPNRLVAFS